MHGTRGINCQSSTLIMITRHYDDEYIQTNDRNIYNMWVLPIIITRLGTCVPTVGTHVPTSSVHVSTVGTHVPTASVHVPTVGTHVPTASVQVPTVGTHIPTTSSTYNCANYWIF